MCIEDSGPMSRTFTRRIEPFTCGSLHECWRSLPHPPSIQTPILDRLTHVLRRSSRSTWVRRSSIGVWIDGGWGRLRQHSCREPQVKGSMRLVNVLDIGPLSSMHIEVGEDSLKPGSYAYPS